MTTTRLSPEQAAARWEHYIDLLRSDRLPFAAAREARILPKDVYARRRKDPDFALQEELAIAECAEKYERVIQEAALAPPNVYDPESKTWTSFGPSKDAVAAAEKWLKARARYIWSPDRTMTVEHKHTVELSSPEDLKALAVRLEERRAKAMTPYQPAALTAGSENDIEDAEVIEDDD